MRARRFKSTGVLREKVVTNTNISAAVTLAVYLRAEEVTATTELLNIFNAHASGGAQQGYGIGINKLKIQAVGGAKALVTSALTIELNRDVVIGFRKATGTVKPVLFRYYPDTGVYTEEEGSATLANPTAPGTTGTYRLNEWEATDKGQMTAYAAGLWNVARTKAECEEICKATFLTEWTTLGEDAKEVWLFDQPSVPYKTLIEEDAPKGYWRLGEASGTSAADSSGNTQTGEYKNTPTLGVASAIAGESNTAATFVRASSQYVTVPDSATLDLGDVLSYEIWFKRASTGTLQTLLDKGPNQLIVRFLASNKILVRRNGVANICESTVTVTDTTTWHHLVVTKNGATVKVWLDGVDVTGTVTNQTLTNTAIPLTIGASEAGAEEWWDGSLDEVAVYGTALSEARVKAHFFERGREIKGLVDVGSTQSEIAGTEVVTTTETQKIAYGIRYLGEKTVVYALHTSMEIEKPTFAGLGDWIHVGIYAENTTLKKFTVKQGESASTQITPDVAFPTSFVSGQFWVIHDGTNSKIKVTWEGNANVNSDIEIDTYRNVDPTTPVNVTGTQASGASTVVKWPKITTTVDFAWQIGMQTNSSGSGFETVPSGWTKRGDYSPQNWSRVLGAKGETTEAEGKWVASKNFVALTFAIAPERAAVESTVTFEFSPTGTSVSSFSETDIFELIESAEGSSVSSFSEVDVLEWIESASGTSSSTGEASGSVEDVFFFSVNGESVSSASATDSFEASESPAGSSTSSGSITDAFEITESPSGSSSSSGESTLTYLFVETAEGTSISVFEANDEASFTETANGTSASNAIGTLDEAIFTESNSGESHSTGSQTTLNEFGEPDQPDIHPLEHRGRRRPVRWKFILVRSSDMEEIGEIKSARNKQVQLALDKPGGCNFNVPLDYDLFKNAEEINHGILTYRNKKPLFSGMIWNLDEQVDANQMSVQAVGWYETLNHRILRENVGYPPFGTGTMTAGKIVFTAASGSVGLPSYHPGGLLTIANGQQNTWIVEGTTLDKMARIISYQKGQNIGQAITQLTEIEAGFDFWIDPLTRVMSITNWDEVPDKRNQIVFGYNWGNHNIEKLGRQFDPSTMVNRMTALGKFGGGFVEDKASQAKYQLFEEMPQLSEVVDPNVLLGYAGGEILLRKEPRILYSFTPFPYSGSPRVPEPFIDYGIGDIISFTAVRPPRVDIRGQAARVYGMNIDISEEGNEKISSLQISPT